MKDLDGFVVIKGRVYPPHGWFIRLADLVESEEISPSSAGEVIRQWYRDMENGIKEEREPGE